MQPLIPGDKPNIATLLAEPRHGPERSPCFYGISAVFDRFRNVRFELFVNLAAYSLAAKNICHARPH
ncbi:MAG TPA: hypothetical protein VLX58_20005 [Bryobacteraceae bacterium]|nr:hypothetical protein [Bryobacteraceae bacterium]